MALTFLFREDKDADFATLHQGDILQRTETLREVIRAAHPYYADAADYHFFMILTQSCDLVRRGKRPAKARYITLAAIRPLDIVVERLVKRFEVPLPKFPILICQKQNEAYVKHFLERLLNNTEPGFFFIRRDSHPVFKRDYCTFLALSIALRGEHYDACARAKVAQLDDVFQAKVGWLAGNLYSRVGTPDIGDFEDNPETYKQAFFDEVLYERSVWLTPEQRRQLEQAVRGGAPKNEQDARRVLDSLKDDAQILAERIADRLIQEIIKDKSKRETIINIISSDKVIRRLIASDGTSPLRDE